MKCFVYLAMFILLFSLKVDAKNRSSASVKKSTKKSISAKKSSLNSTVEKLFNAKKYEKVIDVCDGKWPLISITSLSYLSTSFNKLKVYSSEIKVLEFIKSKKPKQYMWYYKLGLAYERLHKETKKKEYQKKSTEQFRQTIDLNPNFRPAYSKILQMFAGEGNMYEGRTIASVMVKQFGPTPDVNQGLCKMYSLDGYIQDAISYCSRAIEQQPKFPDSYMYLANSFLDQEKKPKAKEIFSKAARQFKKSEFVQLTTGDFNFSEGLYRASLKNYKRVLRVNRESKAAYLGVAESLFKINKVDAALKYYVKACKMDNRYVKEFKLAAGHLLNRGQTKSLSEYESSIFKCFK